MATINIYFDYAQNCSPSRTRGEPMSAEEIGDIKWRVERFGGELAFGIQAGDMLTVLSKSIGDRVAAYGISSSLSLDDLKNRIEQTAKGLKLTPTHLQHS